jgi:hypothetical protein
MRINRTYLPSLLYGLLCLLVPNACQLNGYKESIKQPPLVSAASTKTQPTPQGAGAWQPASYRGLTMGQSTYQDMLYTLGSPKGTFPDNVDETVSYTFSEIAEFPGLLTIIVNRRRRVIAVNINPQDLSKERALAYFGSDFVTTKYAFDNCADEPKSDQLYESSNGTLTYLEYRERGIALLVNSEGKIGGINYVSKPIGKVKSSCK